MAKVRPLHDRLLVKRIEETETVKGGIIIPDSAKETKVSPRVVARRLRLVAHQITGRRNAKTSDELMRLCGFEAKGILELHKSVRIAVDEENITRLYDLSVGRPEGCLPPDDLN